MLKTSAKVENWWKQWLVSDTIQVRLFMVHVQPLTEWHYVGLCNGYWRFYRNDRDGAHLYSNGRRIPLEAQRLYLIPAGVAFDCDLDTSNSPENREKSDSREDTGKEIESSPENRQKEILHFYVHFDVVGLPFTLLRALFNEIYCFPRSSELESAIADVFAEWQRLEHSTPMMLCKIKYVIYAGFALMMQNLSPELILLSGRTGACEAIGPAIQYIENHLTEELTNERLAEICKLSRSHFIRKFQQSMDRTPAEYVQEKRIVSACHLLLLTTDSIETVAEQCGFGDRYYFTRVFTRRMGISPAAYRKQSA